MKKPLVNFFLEMGCNLLFSQVVPGFEVIDIVVFYIIRVDHGHLEEALVDILTIKWFATANLLNACPCSVAFGL
ncbi:MAG: hypothetical protein ACE362_24965 [Phaeodactylibacter xiamenensis]|uniref:hypothetical protein n=1 Tax=Phaeodactylibacter xiamenensis TaxID=1524460 RepID=UPI00126A7559|nr:hypothetical protein [Phaeodactylibacter xiamenensis]MCR9053952.1 hypothetical protein [bacterium]